MQGRPYRVPATRQNQARRQLVGFYPQLVGAAPQLVGAGFQGQQDQRLMGLNPGSNGTYLVDGTPTQTRQWPFPMPSASAGPGATASSSNTAQLMVRPSRLTISETTGPSVLTDISVGQRSQFINKGGEVPIAMFGPTAVDSLVNFDTAQIGNSITLEYLNNGLASTVISAALLCATAAY